MHRADTGAGEHGIGGFGNHGHVYTDAIAFFHPAAFEHIGQLANLLMQFVIGDFFVDGRVVAFPDNRGLIAATGQMPIDAVDADVECAAFEPADMPLLIIPVEHRIPGFVPVKKGPGLFAPEACGIIDGLLIQAKVIILSDMGAGGDSVGDGINFFLCHDFLLKKSGKRY